jgi:hypothetical protein
VDTDSENIFLNVCMRRVDTDSENIFLNVCMRRVDVENYHFLAQSRKSSMYIVCRSTNKSPLLLQSLGVGPLMLTAIRTN